VDDRYLRALKVFVVVAGIGLVLGTGTLIWLLLERRAREAELRRDAAPVVVDLRLPAGARIEQMVLDGARLVLLLRGEEERQYLTLVNPATGERLSLIRAVPDEP
jgi:hypothetical protein